MTNKKKAFRFEVEILYEGNAGMPRPCTLKNWICDSLKSHRSPPGTFASRELAGRNVVVGENQASISVTCLRVQDSRDQSMKARVMPAHQPKSLVWKYPGRFTFLTWHDNVKSCQIPRWRGNLVGPFSPWAPRSLPFVSQMSGQP